LMKLGAGRAIGCAAAVAVALGVSACGGPAAPLAAIGQPVGAAVSSEPDVFPGHRPGRTQPSPPPKVAAAQGRHAQGCRAQTGLQARSSPGSPARTKPTTTTPAPARAPYLSNFTCKPLGGDKYYIQFTRNRPPASPVRFPAMTWTGNMWVGTAVGSTTHCTSRRLSRSAPGPGHDYYARKRAWLGSRSRKQDQSVSRPPRLVASDRARPRVSGSS
jgi:hypothetical protein